ncbi:MAG: OmpA family protein [Betaproteobacteria bacterium]|nr:OmpA family protein [Betaproteobacteria bacterium]
MSFLLRQLAILFCAALSLTTLAQDAPNSKDHPLLTRFPDSRIEEYSQGYATAEFSVGKARNGDVTLETIEGDVTRIRYFFNNEQQQPSPLAVMRNYQNAIRAAGGKVLFERLPSEGDGGETTLRVTSGGRTITVQVLYDLFSAPTKSYQLVFAELAALEQVVSANKLLDELNTKGFVTLYINFDTNKSNIKPDAKPALDEVAKALKSAPNMKIAIEGHTDNAGQAAANKTLSDARAKSVMQALVSQGIAAARLSAAGFGQEKPIADNRSEEGRAKNRRVELIKR